MNDILIKRISEGKFYSRFIKLIDSNDSIRVKVGNQELVLNILANISENRDIPVVWQRLYGSAKTGELTQITTKSSYSEVLDKLQVYLERVSSIPGTGEFMIRGDVIIANIPLYDFPIRISFFGDAIEDIALFDSYKRVSRGKLTQFFLLDLPDIVKDGDVGIINPNSAKEVKFIQFVRADDDIELVMKAPKLYFSNQRILQRDIEKYMQNGFSIYLDAEDEFINQLGVGGVQKYHGNFQKGFVIHDPKILLLTKRELFSSLKLKFEFADNQKDLEVFQSEISLQDYVVHEDHGIARYVGLENKKILDRQDDYLILEYAKGDKLYIPYSQIAKISKYEGFGPEPKLTRLNSTEWRNVKKKVRNSVKILAMELIQLYAARMLSDGFAYSPSEDFMESFASKFEFEMTQDQLRSWEEISSDMESEKPMDRLLVGDVGFGKTELAMRAAFKAVLDGKQVAVLVPTTILASQHYVVFKKRFKDFDVNIDHLSRFTKKKSKEILGKLKDGSINIIIGTHRLLSGDVEFEDLGLYIIDEEQKFGVKQKEKLKRIRLDADVLSMSATPIPRSLYMSLVKLRDISIISTPPKGRKPVLTEALELDWNVIAEKIDFELSRHGQVYFLHNEVRTIESVASRIRDMFPMAKVSVAHAQMDVSTLEKRTDDFFQGKSDILVCTTIIQNGIDIPNVNTIIINKAHKLGLSQLYQLRGRVGRSKKQAYCYLVYPKQRSLVVKVGNEEAGKKRTETGNGMDRIETIIANQELGSGFNIASKDLEMRGAGSILGYKQSGSIRAIGLGLYTQILAEEMDRLRILTSQNKGQQI